MEGVCPKKQAERLGALRTMPDLGQARSAWDTPQAKAEEQKNASPRILSHPSRADPWLWCALYLVSSRVRLEPKWLRIFRDLRIFVEAIFYTVCIQFHFLSALCSMPHALCFLKNKNGKSFFFVPWSMLQALLLRKKALLAEICLRCLVEHLSNTILSATHTDIGHGEMIEGDNSHASG